MKKLWPLILFCISCHHLETGEIVDKQIEPARTHIVLIPMRIGKITTFTPVPMYDDEDYKIHLKGIYRGEVREEWFYISQEQYDKYKVGENICVTEGCSTEPNNDVRK